MRKFDEGGFLTKEGKNEAIDDDTRARARKFVEDASEESQDIKTPKASAPVKKSSAPTSKASTPAPKAKSDWDKDTKISAMPDTPRKPETKEENTTRMEGLTKKQALENVSPEDYIPGSGMLKAGLKAIAGAGARRAAKEGTEAGVKQIAKDSTETGVKQIANNPTKKISLDKDTYKSALDKAREARANARTNKMREENADAGAPGRARASGSTNDMGGTFNAYELRSDYKKGGSVKSASSRADGCAVRGKTRA